MLNIIPVQPVNLLLVVSWGFYLPKKVRVVFLYFWGWDEALSWQTFLPRGFCTMCVDVNLLAHIRVRWVSTFYNVPVWMTSKLFGLDISNLYSLTLKFFFYSLCLSISLNWGVNQCQWYRNWYFLRDGNLVIDRYVKFESCINRNIAYKLI